MDLIRERVNLSSYQFAICTKCRVISTCFETAHLIDFVSAELSTSGDAENFIFDFISIETSTSGDAETFIFVFIPDIKGLLAFLGHFDPYCLTKGAHFHHVASCHASVINLLHVPYNFGPHTRPAEAISVLAEQLIKSMFLLHALCSSCKYFVAFLA